jgi:hypothetical protein
VGITRHSPLAPPGSSGPESEDRITPLLRKSLKQCRRAFLPAKARILAIYQHERCHPAVHEVHPQILLKNATANPALVFASRLLIICFHLSRAIVLSALRGDMSAA